MIFIMMITKIMTMINSIQQWLWIWWSLSKLYQKQIARDFNKGWDSYEIHRDGRFRVNDEIINVNGSSLRGLSMEQVFIIIIIIIINIVVTIIIHDNSGKKCFEEHVPKCGHHHCQKPRRSSYTIFYYCDDSWHWYLFVYLYEREKIMQKQTMFGMVWKVNFWTDGPSHFVFFPVLSAGPN